MTEGGKKVYTLAMAEVVLYKQEGFAETA